MMTSEPTSEMVKGALLWAAVILTLIFWGWWVLSG
jgi:hypothetical protein